MPPQANINIPDDEDQDQRPRREDVMSEDEIKLADKYLQWYRSSHRDKVNRGLFEKWEEIESYWEGDANPPDGDADPGMNTNIVMPSVEGQVAYLVEQNIAIQTRPEGPSDLPYAEDAMHLLEWCMYKNKIKRKLDVHERRRKKFGTGIFRVLFDPDALNGFGLPVIEPRHPAYVFTDPAITDIYSFQEGRFVIEVANKSIYWAEMNFDENRVAAIAPGFHPMEEEMLFGEDENQLDAISKQQYLHMYVWSIIKQNGDMVLRLVQMSGDGVILSDSLNDSEESFYPVPKYPYFLTPIAYREGTVWAKTEIEELLKTQNLIDDLDDQIVMNARLTGNLQKIVSTNAGIDIDKWTNEPGLNIPADGPLNDAYRIVQPPDMPQYVTARRNLALQYERTVITRFSDQMNGIKQEGVDTATESLGLQQGGTQGIDHAKMLLEETLAEVFEYCLELMMEYYTEEKAFRITEDNKFRWINPSELKNVPLLIPSTDVYQQSFMNQVPGAVNAPQWMPHPEDETKKADFDVEVTVGAGLPQNKGYIFQMANQAVQIGAISPPEYRKLLIDYVGLPLDENPPQPPMPPQQSGQPQPGMMPPGGIPPAAAGAPPNAAVAGMTAGNMPQVNPAAAPGGGGM